MKTLNQIIDYVLTKATHTDIEESAELKKLYEQLQQSKHICGGKTPVENSEELLCKINSILLSL